MRTIVLTTPLDMQAQELSRSVSAAIGVLSALMRDSYAGSACEGSVGSSGAAVVPGGGCAEAAMAAHIRQWCAHRKLSWNRAKSCSSSIDTSPPPASGKPPVCVLNEHLCETFLSLKEFDAIMTGCLEFADALDACARTVMRHISLAGDECEVEGGVGRWTAERGGSRAQCEEEYAAASIAVKTLVSPGVGAAAGKASFRGCCLRGGAARLTEVAASEVLSDSPGARLVRGSAVLLDRSSSKLSALSLAVHAASLVHQQM